MNDVSLRDYIEARLRGLEDKLDSQRDFNALHFDLNEKAILKAEESMTNRLAGMNEFREQIKEERGYLATKDNLVSIGEALNSRLKLLEESKAFAAGRMWMIMALFALIPTIIALVALFGDGK